MQTHLLLAAPPVAWTGRGAPPAPGEAADFAAVLAQLRVPAPRAAEPEPAGPPDSEAAPGAEPPVAEGPPPAPPEPAVAPNPAAGEGDPIGPAVPAEAGQPPAREAGLPSGDGLAQPVRAEARAPFPSAIMPVPESPHGAARSEAAATVGSAGPPPPAPGLGGAAKPPQADRTAPAPAASFPEARAPEAPSPEARAPAPQPSAGTAPKPSAEAAAAAGAVAWPIARHRILPAGDARPAPAAGPEGAPVFREGREPPAPLPGPGPAERPPSARWIAPPAPTGGTPILAEGGPRPPPAALPGEGSMPDLEASALPALQPAAAELAGPRWTPPGLASQAAQQLAGHLNQRPIPPAEVALNPPELGRVAIRFEGDPAGGILHLVVERPETLDLMRRHVDLLETALRAAGHEGCAIALGGRDPGGGGSGRGPEGAPGPADPAPAAPPAAAPSAAAGRLDLRL